MAAKSVFGEGESYLHPQDTRQYLYQLDPKSSTDLVTRSTPSLGKLDIIWRTSLGQLGRLQTSQLSRKVPQMELLELAIIGMPSTIYSEEPFRATLRVTNNTSDAVHIMVSSVKAKMSSILLSGVSEKDLGWVGGRDSFKFELDFFPLLTGLHKLSGLRLTDMTTGYTRDVDNLTDILVVYSNN